MPDWRWPRSVIATVLATLCVVAAGCGGDSDEESTAASEAGSSRFPAEQFPPETFGDLDGKVSWYDTSGGANTETKAATLYKNFTDLTGVPVTSDFNADTSKFLAAMEAGQAPWNVVQFPTVGDFLHAKEKGYLAPLDTEIVPVDRLEDGTYDEYGFHSERFGIVLAWNTEKWPESGPQPEAMTDLFDTETFPGKRCMFKSPQFGATLESALLADGVAEDALYPLDVPRALRKLDTIKSDIVWWSSGDQAIQFLRNGECDLGIAWSGRVFDAVQKDDAPLKLTWNKALYGDTAYGIPKDAPDMEAAQAMLAMMVLDEEGQKKFVEKIPYPTPIKGMEYPESLSQWLPVGDNSEAAIAVDEEYYAENIESLSKEFTAWLGS